MSIPEDPNRPQQPEGAPADLPPAPPVPPAAPVPPAEAPVGTPVAPAVPPAPPAPPTSDFLPPAPAAPGAFPSYSGSAAPVVERPTTTPTTINVSFWLYIASAVLSVVSGIVALSLVSGTRQTVIDQLERQGTTLQGQNIQQLADTAIAVGIGVLIVTTIFWAIVFVLFAFLMRRGANWARIVLTVLTAISLLNLGSAFGIGFAQVAAAVAAAILLWLPASSQWFAAIKASKAPRA